MAREDAGLGAPPDAGPFVEASDAGPIQDAGLPPITAATCGDAGDVVPLGLCSTGWCWDSPSPTGNDLTSVLALATDDVWVGGQQTLLHWDGHQWTASGDSPNVVALWGNASNDVWAADDQGVLVWNGQAWTRVFSHDRIAALSASGPSDVWAAASDALWHWDGATWSIVDVPMLSAPPTLVWANAANDVWVTQQTQAVHWDGTAWAELDPDLQPLEGYAVSDDGLVTDNIAFVGGVPGAFHVATVTSASAWFEDGGWTDVVQGQDSSNDTDATSLWNGMTAVHVAGPGQAIPAFETANWTDWEGQENDCYEFGDYSSSGYSFSSGCPAALTPLVTAMSGTSATDIWAVGGEGLLLHFDGVSWTTPMNPVNGAVLSVWDDGAGRTWGSVQLVGLADDNSSFPCGDAAPPAGWRTRPRGG